MNFIDDGQSARNTQADFSLHWTHISLRSFSHRCLVVCVEVLRPSQPIGVMSCAVSLPYDTFTGQA